MLLAILEAIVCPGSKRLEGIPSALPITMVTAIVSPSARPSASSTAPINPMRAVGITTSRIASHRVAPMPM